MQTSPDGAENIRAGEVKAFFAAVAELRAAQRNGNPIDELIEEIEAIVQHTEQLHLRRRAKAVLAEIGTPAAVAVR
jgi:hypothetical protein